ncbi:hypothetical protein LSAT2_012648 [Lamellibrachia satsuma]|nr:hypothetical protein LSAT2_012648 [Lamellibrachia satsuma]
MLFLSHRQLHTAFLRHRQLHTAFLPHRQLHTAFLPHRQLHTAFLPHIQLHTAFLPHRQLHTAFLPHRQLHTLFLPHRQLHHTIFLPHSLPTSQKTPHAKVTVGGISLTAQDLSTLSPGEWLNDQVIHAYLGVLSTENTAVYILPCFLAILLDMGQFTQWLFDQVCLANYQWIFFPICHQNHWFILVANPQEKTVAVLDSLDNELRRKKFVALWHAPTQGQTQRGRGFPFRGRSFHPGYGGRGRWRGFRGRNATNQVVFDATAHDSTYYDIYMVDTSPSLHLQRKERQPPILANVLLNGQPLTLEVDTGAATSLINEETYRTLWEEPPPLEPAHERLRSYLGEKIPLLASARVNVRYGDQSADVQVLIVQGKRANLFGRDWLKEIRLDWGSIMKVGSMELENTLNLYSDVFREELGEFKGTKVKIDITVPAQPRFYKHRNISYVLRERVESGA